MPPPALGIKTSDDTHHAGICPSSQHPQTIALKIVPQLRLLPAFAFQRFGADTVDAARLAIRQCQRRRFHLIFRRHTIRYLPLAELESMKNI